jgi:hypothetical protein
VTDPKQSSQPIRLVYLGLYLGFLFAMNRMAFGQWLPMISDKGLWFYSGAAALILGSLLVTPFFTSPANAISYLVAAFIAVFVFPASSAAASNMLPRQSVLIFFTLMLVACTLSIMLKDSKNRVLHNLAEAFRQMADHLGSPRFVYALVITYALWEYHRSSPQELFFVGISGLVIAAQQPLETLGSMIQRIRSLWRSGPVPTVVGIMVGHQTPDLVLIRQDGDEAISHGHHLLMADKHGRLRIGVTLGYFGRDEGLLLRALEIEVPEKSLGRLNELSHATPKGCVSVLPPGEIDSFRDEVYCLKHQDSLIGIVAADTSTERLYFEIIQERDVEQGRLVETFVGSKRVLYQILDGLTKEEVVQQKNTRGFARGEASQVGVWDEEKRKFDPCNWIPLMNAPIFLKTIEAAKDNKEAIGHFPSTGYQVEIRSLDEMVTHNTAILGILGVGKSMLAIELVERLIVHGIKVICLDLTNQYEQALTPYLPGTLWEEAFERLRDLGPAGKANYKQNVEEGGSKGAFVAEVSALIDKFLSPDCTGRLIIFNPSLFEVWRQDSKLFNNMASMAPLTPTEITRIISDAALQAAQKQGMTDKARVCLVYEEAHSLIPEWNSVAADGDKAATNGTARAILQGRKYGLGCLLVTQRTANVTKTILNQCNTIFAMRTFDDTGKDFLSSYVGLKYSDKLSSLQERQAVVFGRASSCNNPVLVRLNDRDDFLRIFRGPHFELPGGVSDSACE